MSQASVSLFTIIRSDQEGQLSINDLVAVEEPLEIILDYGPLEQRKSINLAITMRTPGNDLELVTGFLATEQLVNSPEQIVGIRHCKTTSPPAGHASHSLRSPSASASAEQLRRSRRAFGDGSRAGRHGNQAMGNTVKVQLDPLIKFDPGQSLRHFYINSSCGVCGKTSIDSVIESCGAIPSGEHIVVSQEVIRSLPTALREKQLVFDHTGGLHAACLFDLSGKPLCWREDVGRHNALDKVLGASFALNKWPLDQAILLVSGRVSFELVQKAIRAGIRFMAAIGAPSSLAVELARRADMTLLGFVGKQRFNIYHGEKRVELIESAVK